MVFSLSLFLGILLMSAVCIWLCMSFRPSSLSSCSSWVGIIFCQWCVVVDAQYYVVRQWLVFLVLVLPISVVCFFPDLSMLLVFLVV